VHVPWLVLVALVLGLMGIGGTIGALAVYAKLAPKIECAYHEGMDDGYATGRSEVERDYTPTARQAQHQSRD
jgi:hypothetical protein